MAILYIGAPVLYCHYKLNFTVYYQHWFCMQLAYPIERQFVSSQGTEVVDSNVSLQGPE